MLKTLRVTSLVTVILAAIGVVAIVVLGLKGDPQIKAFLAKPFGQHAWPGILKEHIPAA